MRRVLIAAGTLGGGTLIAFVLAGLAFLADPVGRLVPVNPWSGPLMGGPVPQPAILVDPAIPQRIPAAAEDAVANLGGGAAPAIPAEIDDRAAEEFLRNFGR